MSPTSIRRKLLFLFLFIFVLILAGAGFFLSKVQTIDQETAKINALTLSEKIPSDSVATQTAGVINKSENKALDESLSTIGISNKMLYWGLIVFTISVAVL